MSGLECESRSAEEVSKLEKLSKSDTICPFWLYVAEIVHSPGRAVAYVGRTGDASSANAASLFTRITAHLSEKKNAKANSLLKRLVEQGLPCQECSYRFIGIGPLFEQQTSMDLHKPIRDQMASIERAVADHLRDKGYLVLGEHPKARHVDVQILNRVLKVVDEEFREPNAADGRGASDAQ